MRQDHPFLTPFLKAYRTINGTESVQVLASGALWPLKAARAWTAHLADQKPLKTQPIRS